MSTDRTEAERLAEAMDITVNITHRDGFIRGDAQKQLEAVLANRDAQIARLQQERDLAIAHDRQPYPTVEAYELACKQRDAAIREAEALRSENARLHGKIAAGEFEHIAAPAQPSER